jgi:hypothetical protein
MLQAAIVERLIEKLKRTNPGCGGTSRMTRECQVRICERLGVKFPGPTRQKRRIDAPDDFAALPLFSQKLT